jgi:WS/DGAT/MGAT family acyltransferase
VHRLNSHDASFLALDGPSGVGHICLVAELDGRLTIGELRAVVESHLAQTPILRKRLLDAPLGLARPWWVDDPDFDLDHHLRVHDRRSAGGLAACVADIAARPLDRAHPLWELHLVQLPRRSAVVSKLHHACADGIGGRDLLLTLLGADTPNGVAGEPSEVWQPERTPGRLEVAARTALSGTDVVGRVIRLERAALRRVPGAFQDLAGSARQVPEMAVEWLTTPSQGQGWPRGRAPRVRAPATPFNTAITARRAWAYTTLSLAASRPARRATGATVNDLVLAATAGALRTWLIELRSLPAAPLRALVPFSVRPPGDTTPGNQIGLLTCALPTDHDDPADRLESVRGTTAVARRHGAMSAQTLQDLTAFAPPLLATRAAGLIASVRLANRVRLPFNLVVSNVPGTPATLRCGRHRILTLYPLPALGDGVGLNVTVQGYRNRLHVGVVTCPDVAPRPDRFVELLASQWRLVTALR